MIELAQSFSKAFYESVAWRKCRNSFFIYKAGLCEQCGGVGLVAHHIIWLSPSNINDASIALNWDNLMMLCQTCHTQLHLKSPSTEGGLMFDDVGNLIQKRAPHIDLN